MFFATLKVFLLFVGPTGFKISGVTVEIGPNYDRIIFLITLVIGWKTAYFFYASGGWSNWRESTNHVVAAFFVAMPLLFSAGCFFLGSDVWLPVWSEFTSFDDWAFRVSSLNGLHASHQSGF